MIRISTSLTLAALTGIAAVTACSSAMGPEDTDEELSAIRQCHGRKPCDAGVDSGGGTVLDGGPTTTDGGTTTPDSGTFADSAPPSSPSGEPLPLGNVTGWTQIFTDDFTQNVALGSFPEAVSAKWTAYPYPWSGTPTWAQYDPHRTTSFHDGMMDVWIHTDAATGEHLIAANEPLIHGAGVDRSQLYGRYVIRYRTDSFGYYKPSWLLWPKSEVWPRDGEIDFPEQGQFSDTSVCAFMHRQSGTSGGDQDAYCTSGYATTQWHTAVIEWLPARCTFILDGKVIGNSTSRIPNTPMRYVIQNNGSYSTGVAPASVQGHVYIDWVAVYQPT